MLIQLHVILEALVGKLNLIFRPPHLYRGQTNKYAQYGCFQPILITNNYTIMLQYQWSATNYSLQNDCKVEQTTKTAPIKTSWRVDLLRGCKHRTAGLKRCLPDTMANECIFTFNQKCVFFIVSAVECLSYTVWSDVLGFTYVCWKIIENITNSSETNLGVILIMW